MDKLYSQCLSWSVLFENNTQSIEQSKPRLMVKEWLCLCSQCQQTPRKAAWCLAYRVPASQVVMPLPGKLGNLGCLEGVKRERNSPKCIGMADKVWWRDLTGLGFLALR